MKHQSKLKPPLNKIAIFSILLLLLNGFPYLTFSQDVNPSIRVRQLKPKPLEQHGRLSPQSFPPDFIGPQNKAKENKQLDTTTNLKKIKTTPQKLKPGLL